MLPNFPSPTSSSPDGTAETRDRILVLAAGGEPDSSLRDLQSIYRVRNAFAASWVPPGEHAPDLFICDTSREASDIAGLIRRIRLTRQTAGVPILILVREGCEIAGMDALKAGADDYLMMPDGRDELHRRVRALLERPGGEPEPATGRANASPTDIPVAIFTKDLDGRYTHANPFARRVMGIPEDLAGRTDYDIHPPETANSIRQHDLEVIATRGFLQREEDLDGQRFLLSKFPIFDSSGNPAGICGVAVDITERTQLEKLLRESQVKLRALAEHAPVGIFLSAPDGQTLFVNNQWCQMAGMPAEQALGGGWTKALHPEDRDRVITGWSEALAAENASDAEFRFLKPDGSVTLVRGRTSQLLDSAGNLTGYIGSCVDITLRKRQQAALQESEQRFRAIVRQAAAGVVQMDTRGAFHMVNRAWCEMLGYSEEELLGLSLDQVTHPDDLGESLRQFHELLEGGPDFIIEKRYRRKDGSTLWAISNVSALRNEDGEIGWIIALVMDTSIRKRAETELANLTETSERRRRLYDNILSNTPDLIYVFDTHRRFIYANKALLETWGKTWDEAIGKTSAELGYEPWQVEMIERDIAKVISTGRAVRGEMSYAGTNGRKIYDYIFSPVAGSDGKVEYLTGTTRDVTERKQAEQQAHFLSDLAEKIARIPDERGIIGTTAEAVGLFLDADQCYFAELAQTGDPQLVHPGWARDHSAPQEDPHFLSLFGEAGLWNQSAARDFSIDDVENAPLTRDHAAELRLIGVRSFACQPFKADGSVTVLLGVACGEPREWTANEMSLLDNAVARVWPLVERARTDASLRENRLTLQRQSKRLRLLWEAAGIILTSEDPDTMLQRLFARIREHIEVDTYFNFMVEDSENVLTLRSCQGIPQNEVNRISRIPFGEAICGNVALRREAIVATHIQESEDLMAQLVRSYGIRSYACNPLMAGDQLLGTLSFASTTRDHFTPDELEFMETISHHVTGAYERHRLVADLRESDRRKDQFLATLAHELRNPLAPILTGLEVMLRSASDPEAVGRVAAMMQRQTHQIVHLIDDLLDISRITTGKIVLKKTTTSLDSIIRSAVEAAQPLIEKFHHELDLVGSDPEIDIEGDPHRIAQIISNLLSNAAKYTPPHGRILLEASMTSPHGVSILVRDNGFGIDEDSQRKIFNLFEQDDHGRNDGLGIGLTLVKSLVEMHDGTVSVRSDGPGKGSEFRVELPGCSHRGARTSPELVRDLPRHAAKRVLVVDDGKNTADILALFFRLEGMEVEVAYDGQEALDLAEDFLPDLVFMDLGMPRVDGFEAARRMRNDRPSVILIALSGWGRDEDKERSAEAGFDDHLIKPVSPEDLRKVLRTFGVTRP